MRQIQLKARNRCSTLSLAVASNMMAPCLLRRLLLMDEAQAQRAVETPERANERSATIRGMAADQENK
jgi:hypothetical protein